MSLYGMMRTGVSGMNAQANRLSTVADNIANSDTTGYKRSSAEFSTLVMPSTGGAYNSGGVTTTIRQAVSDPGVLQYTTSVSDLAVSGDGFFVVQDPSGTPYLTRAGAFVPDGQGRLVNSAGFQLMAYSYENGVPAATVNGFEGLVPVVISDQGMTATPSTEGSFAGNLPAGATPVATANLPAANAATAQYTSKSSMVAYDNLGNKKLLDVYFTNTGAGTWQVAVFDQSKATAGTSFPYTAGGLLGSANLTFDTTTGKLTGTPTNVSFTVPNGATLNLDLSALTQLGTGFTVSDAQVNGNAPSTIDKVQISKDGTIYAQYKDGSTKPLYKIPLADVQSPDQLKALPGNVYSQGTESGAVRVGFANEGKLGSIISGALENSNVDIAEELTNMIAAQRSYTANSKVFQTGSDLMDVLVNLKR
ncbi:flagellar hook protein FlgE [Mesorhizobium ciceri]|uniref:Flagellar hook protein FlgE n=8 Tax=Mesorhizobium TaxID=68287 RepID=E8TFU9_MESCW|nr:MULTISPECIES: flagellar hook protein FlgE [Mesorhizobium]RUZ88508.1 flagellar hook protein FlgE [Mesorhizobium sp. M7A.F.Ca.US.003.02.2.1]ADV11091.1 flagellar hook-basal body protein [Mesorhizobium ciceri biovar biserrulae WSM1271]AMX94647.1 flagellar biosynthesis protein FlgE [Mesorhizobium ciceri]AMY02178.1 flagellar biosynthesis protein FlgE [Mesorhizobium ciceri biovar biserrulae]ARP63694.1 flagellar hook protein FlgE [Mesorhizobium sp. WSM1497]